MDTGTGLSVVIIVAVFTAAFAPVILAIGGSKAMPVIVTLILTLSAGAVFAFQPTVFGQIFAGIVWLGAVMVGSASYIAEEVAVAMRISKKTTHNNSPRPRRADVPHAPPQPKR